jgi:TRAP-type C4-dicarboxylate transport system substrate-binding protein
MKRISFVFILMILVLGFFFYCQVESASAKDKVIELKFNDWGPPGIGIGKLHQQAAKMIEDRTNGKVKVNCFFSQSLLKYMETFRGVSSNITDISLYVAMPFHEVNRIIGMTFTGLPGMIKSSKIFEEMIKNYPEFNQEFEKNGVRWIAIRSMPPTQLHLVKKPVKLPQDLKGMRVIGDPYMADAYKKVGAAVLQLGPPDWYSSLERGVAEAHMVHYAASYEFKIQELFKYHTHFGEGAGGATPIGFVVNVNKWNSLSPDIQEVIMDVYNWVNEESLKWDVGIVNEAIESAKKDGHIITELSPSEVQTWLDWAKPSNDKLLEQIASKGWQARRIYDGMQQLIQKYK